MNLIFNSSGLEWSMTNRSGQFYVGIFAPQQWLADAIKLGQEYLIHNTTLGIPAIVQTEGIHGFLAGKFHQGHLSQH